MSVGRQRRGSPKPPPPAPFPPGERAVRLTVLRDDHGGALASVDVTINGQGPFRFALDTGTSQSVVNEPVAERLGLPTTGPPSRPTGILTVGESVPVRVNGWKARDVDMPTAGLVRVAMPNPPGRRFRLDGLLGADALSRFGAIHVDVTGQVLVLNPRADRGRPTAQ